MAFSSTVYKVMIASPGDVIGARAVVRKMLDEWNVVNADSRKTVLLPVAWDTHTSPAMGDRPQAIINKQILRDCDLLVGIFWTRVGSPTGEYPSGTIEEIEEHIKAGKPVMLYFSDEPVRLDSVDEKQYSELRQFKESCQSRGLYETFSALSEFESKFYRQLQIKLNKDDYFRTSTVSGDEISATAEHRSSANEGIRLSREAQLLLKEASHDADGTVLRVVTMDGFSVETNGKDLVDDRSSARSRAKWESAIDELEVSGLIADRGYKREVFGLTQRGYEVADALPT
jgi:hypothetical protein